MAQDHSMLQVEHPLPGMDKDWLTMLDAYHVRFLVLNLQSESDLVKYFRSQPGWLVDFEDQESIIFARTNAPTCTQVEVPC